MTKRGIVLSVLLALMLGIIIVNVIMQNINIKSEDEKEKVQKASLLYINDDNKLDLDKFKSYGLPIFIQIGSDEDELCAKMKASIEKLYEDLDGIATIRYLDISKFPKILEESGFFANSIPMQILFGSDGMPYKAIESEALGYKMIKDENGNILYTVHYGDLTSSEMIELIENMKSQGAK